MTWTAAPTALPTARIETATPAPETGRPPGFGATATPSATPTRFQPTVALRRELIVEEIPPPRVQLNSLMRAAAGVYEYDLGAGASFDFGGRAIAGDVVLFAPNPALADSFLLTDAQGMPRYKLPGQAAERPVTDSPYFDGYAAASSETNKNRVVEIDWSADGSAFSFRIDPPPGQDNANAGLWFWQPNRELQTDPTYTVFRDCPDASYISCSLVRASNASLWQTLDVAWSPVPGSKAILLRVDLPAESRSALAIVEARRDAHYASQAPNFVRYDYGHWSVSGQEIIVSGRDPHGRVIIAAVDARLGDERRLFDASGSRLWLQDAARMPDGRVVGFGRSAASHPNAPLAMYDSNGRPISGVIGDAAPQNIRWYPDRSAAVLSVGGGQFTVQVAGGHISDSANLARQPVFSDFGSSAPIPSAVIHGSRYRAGQQLRARVSLNVRAGPSTGAQIVGGLFSGDYLAIIAGPYAKDGISWWKAQTANDIVGWVAGEINGAATFVSG